MNKPEFLTSTKPPFAERYDNFIGGKWVAPKAGKYFDNTSPVTGQVVCKIARSDAQDIEAALDAAHAAKEAWGRSSVVERAIILNRIADRMEANLEKLAVAETWDNGKADPRDARRRPAARHRPLPLFRRCSARPGRLTRRDRP